MKNILAISVGLLLVASTAAAQLRTQEQTQQSVANSLIRPASGFNGLLNWFNPDNFKMRHGMSLNYMSSGGSGLSMATYTNSMFYKISDPLNVRFDFSLQGSPFGNQGALAQSEVSRLFISRAELNYQPWENFQMRLMYRQYPAGSFGYHSPFYNPTFSPFGDE